MGFLSRLLARGKSPAQTTISTTAERPFRIPKPTIGFLNLGGAPAAALAEADRRVLSPLFAHSQTSADAVPKCEVLFLYCTLDADGHISGHPAGIRDLIRSAGAYVAVLASENNPNSYIKAMASRNDWRANIAMVIDRKGDKFALFFRKLFEAMFRGQSMLMAWVEIAPQIPGREDPEAPGTIMAAEAGHITFGG